MKLNRRAFLGLAGAAGAAGLAGLPVAARAATRSHRGSDETPAVLVDTTSCIGCRSCELACSQKNGLPEPAMLGEESVFEKKRTTSPQAYTVVNRYTHAQGEGDPTFVKTQCMHCLQPACASACPVRALEKTPEGPIVYHEDRCIGCRYCMVACPFGIPQFEYAKALPYIRKCIFCFDRLRQGESPACADACPGGALQFGKREEMLEEAKIRIYQNPDDYFHHIYGEHEVGGTGWLYIGDHPLEELGLPADLGSTAYPEHTWAFLSAVPIVLTLWPPFLMGLYVFTQNREKTARAEAGQEGAPHE